MEEMISKKSVLKIIQQVRNTILKKQLIECSTTIIVSISGGQDSVFLLFCLSFLQFQINFIFKMVWCNHFWQIDSFYTTLHLTMCAINFASPLITFLPLHAFAVDLTHISLRGQKLDCVFSCNAPSCSDCSERALHKSSICVAWQEDFTQNKTWYEHSLTSKVCGKLNAQPILFQTEKVARFYTFTGSYVSDIFLPVQHKSKICEVPLLAILRRSKKRHGNRSKKGHFTNLLFVLRGNYTEGVSSTSQIFDLCCVTPYRKYDRSPFLPFGHKTDAVFIRNNLSVLQTTCQQKGSFYTNQVRLFSLKFVKIRPKSFDLGLSKKPDFTLLKFQKPAVFNCSLNFTGARTCFFGPRRRMGHRFYTSSMHQCGALMYHPLGDRPSKMMHHTESVHNIFRQIFQAKFVPARRQLLIRQVKIFLSIYQITEFNSFLTFAKTKGNLLNLCKVHRGLILTAFFTYINKNNLIKLFCRWSSSPRIIDTSCSFIPKVCVASSCHAPKEQEGALHARAQSSFASIDKKTITILSETKARHWRHITTQRSSTFYTSKRAIYGHTLSDRVETIIFNLIRGSGNTGIKSLPWKRKLSTFSYNKFYLSLQQVVKNTHLLLEL